MKKTWSFFTVVVLVISIAIAIAIIYLLIWFIYANWAEFEPNTIATVFTGLVVIIGYYQTKKREIEARHFTKKRKAYTDFITILSEVLKAEQRDTPITPEELLQAMYNFRREMIIWGGTDTINAFDNYISVSEAEAEAEAVAVAEAEAEAVAEAELNTETKPEPLATLIAMDNLLRAMRKELGHNDRTLDKGAVVGMFLDQAGKEQLKKAAK